MPICKFSISDSLYSIQREPEHSWLFQIATFLHRLFFAPIPTCIEEGFAAGRFLAFQLPHQQHISVFYHRFSETVTEKGTLFQVGTVGDWKRNEFIAACFTPDQKYLAVIVRQNERYLLKLFDLDDYCEQANSESDDFLSIDIVEDNIGKSAKMQCYLDVSGYLFVISASSKIVIRFFVEFENTERQGNKFYISDCQLYEFVEILKVTDRFVLELTSDSLSLCEFAGNNEVKKEAICISSDNFISTRSKVAFWNDEIYIYQANSSTFSVFSIKKMKIVQSIRINVSDIRDFYVVCEEHCNSLTCVLYLDVSGTVWYYDFRTEEFIVILKNCSTLFQASDYDFYCYCYSNVFNRNIGICKIHIKRRIEIETEMIKTDIQSIDDMTNFIERYLELDPFDGQEIITKEFVSSLNDSQKRLLKKFVPRSASMAKELFTLLDRNNDILLLEYFLQSPSFVIESFQQDFYRLIQLDQESLCKSLAVDCAFELLQIFSKGLCNIYGVLDCIPEFVDPNDYIQLVPLNSNSWIRHRIISVYSNTGNVNFIDTLASLIKESDNVFLRKIHFFDSFFNGLEYFLFEEISSLLSLPTIDIGFKMLTLVEKKKKAAFSNFIVPFYETFHSPKELRSFLVAFITKEPEMTLELLFDNSLIKPEQLEIVFWHFPLSSVKDRNVLLKFFDYFTFYEYLGIESLIKIGKLLVKYSVNFINNSLLRESMGDKDKVMNYFTNIFIMVKRTFSLWNREEFWLDLLGDLLDLLELFEAKVDKLVLFEHFVSCILECEENSLLARDVIEECCALGVFTDENADLLVLNVARQAFLGIVNLCNPQELNNKLGAVQKCLFLRATRKDESEELVKMKILIKSQLPKLIILLSEIDPLFVDLTSHDLLIHSIDWVLLHKILPFHTDAFKNPERIIKDFNLQPSVQQKIYIFSFKRHFDLYQQIKYEYLPNISDPFLWKFIYPILKQFPDDYALFNLFVSLSPPVDLLHEFITDTSQSEFIPRLFFTQRISLIHSTPSKNIFSFPKLCRLLPAKFFNGENEKFYHHCHPAYPQSQQFFAEKAESEKMQMKQKIEDMSIEKTFDLFLEEDSFITIIEENAKNPSWLVQKLTLFILTDSCCTHLPSLDKFCTLSKYFDMNFLKQQIFTVDLLLDRAELLYFSLLNLSFVLKQSVESRIEIIYTMNHLKHQYRISHLFQLPISMVKDLFCNVFDRDVDFLISFCKSVHRISLDEENLDLWGMNIQPTTMSVMKSDNNIEPIFSDNNITNNDWDLDLDLPQETDVVTSHLNEEGWEEIDIFEHPQHPSNHFQRKDWSQIECEICFIFLSSSMPIITTIQQLFNSISPDIYFETLQQYSSSIDYSIQPLICLFLDLHGKFNEHCFHFLSDNPHVTFYIYIKHFIESIRSSSISATSSTDTLLSKIKEIQDPILQELFLIEDCMTKWTFLDVSISRSRLEYLWFFTLNYQLESDLNFVQIAYEESLSIRSQNHQTHFYAFVLAYLLTTWLKSSNPDKQAFELAHKYCQSLRTNLCMHRASIGFDRSHAKMTIFRDTLRYYQNTFQYANPFANGTECYLNETDMIDSLYCIIIERLFVMDYHSVIAEMIQTASEM